MQQRELQAAVCADVCVHSRVVVQRMLTYADVCRRMQQRELEAAVSAAQQPDYVRDATEAARTGAA
jgi:hypothetical protein